ncbi:G-protein coupled receptors family 1 profile domain-containing protein [Caenorhabditis elegans]|nr:G-protein coupled receptors family 1 profile domain-containing protein [Caenorhabditis elegans]CCD63424.2 G-protein coupled receptors family 1 profile domain-containing protein [Caenorhabditis elegans]|eukprot:NP_001023463.2 Serpentine Receptor, class X [Caenorhabditis elegans]
MANWTVALLIRRLPSLKNSFGRLTASQSIGDAIHSTVFAFIFSPMCFFSVEIMKTYSSAFGHILLIAYDISTYSHLCISLNRFCSIVAPIKYDTIFSMSNTKKLIMFSWACAVLPSFYLYIYQDCRFYYIEDFWVFTFSTTPVCNTIVWYADFLKYNSIVISIVIIDVITVSKVRSYKAGLSKTTSQSHEKKRSAEMNFLKQACLQAFVFVCELITYFLITPRVDGSERWLRFFLSTVAWVCVHMLDGVITLSFNKEFTQTIFRGIKIKDLSGHIGHHQENSSNAGATHTTRH